MLYGCYRNGQVKINPKEFIDLCRNWIDPDTAATISGLENREPEYLVNLGIYPADIVIPDYDPIYERINISKWEFNKIEMRLKRIDTKEDLSVFDVKLERIGTVKAQCHNLILAVINQYHQLDVALGIMPDLGYTDWIASMIEESNRCEDAYSSSTTIAEIKLVVPNFPAYVAP
jgi:hypothetical protein